MNQNNKFKQSGFTLIEIMVVLAIIGILAMIALPSYQDYVNRSRFVEIISAAEPFKTGIAECFSSSSDGTADGLSKNCSVAGTNGVPADFTGGTALVNSITVGPNAVITVTPNAWKSIVATDTYILTPLIVKPTTGNSYLTWTASGDSIKKGYAKANP